MKSLDKAAFLVIIIAGLLLSGVIIVGNQVPVYITCQLPDHCTQVGPYGSVLFGFSRPVKSDQVENLWQTRPHITGKWEWMDNQHARWTSLTPLPTDQKITLQFIAGQAGQYGEKISNNDQWDVAVRLPQIVVIQNGSGGQELFSFGLGDGSAGFQLTHSSGRINDYQVSPDGESVVFSAANVQKGIDLWMVNRDGSNQHQLLDCGIDQCITPAWSPTLQELAYTREIAGTAQNGPRQAPRIWIYDVKSGQSASLFADTQKVGYGPKWSPDGQWLSIWDNLKNTIEVVNRQSGETFALPSSNGDTSSWTPDSQFLYYSNMVTGSAGFHNVVFGADIGKRSVATIFGGNVEGGGQSLDNPVCSPDGTWVAVTAQPDVRIAGKELLLLNPGNNKNNQLIVDNLTQVPGFYSWTPRGDRLVYQLNSLGGKENVEIWVWEQATEKTKKITTGGRLPQWLP
jgi:Tol biopolymer transport system component